MHDLIDESTTIWLEDDIPCKLRSPRTVYCNTLSDWLMCDHPSFLCEEDVIPYDPAAFSSIGFLAYDEDFPSAPNADVQDFNAFE